MERIDYGRKLVEIIYHLKESPKEFFNKLRTYEQILENEANIGDLLNNHYPLGVETLQYLFDKYRIDANWYVSDYGNMYHKTNALSSLTTREHDIIDLILQKKNRVEIAKILGMEFETVKWHLKKIFQKLGVNSQQEVYDIFSKIKCNKMSKNGKIVLPSSEISLN